MACFEARRPPASGFFVVVFEAREADVQRPKTAPLFRGNNALIGRKTVLNVARRETWRANVTVKKLIHAARVRA